jgi:hypothetical protein
MGILSKVFDKKQAGPAETVPQSVECPHTMLIPRWDSVEDMGDEAKATAFLCESCGIAFDQGEASQLKADAADKLRRITASSDKEAEIANKEPARL